MTTARLRAHVADLAAEHGVDVQYVGCRFSCEAGGGDRPVIFIPWPRNRETYLIALHELAHANQGEGAGCMKRRHGVLYMEALAWDWALGYSIVEPSESGWLRIEKSLCSYAPTMDVPALAAWGRDDFGAAAISDPHERAIYRQIVKHIRSQQWPWLWSTW